MTQESEWYAPLLRNLREAIENDAPLEEIHRVSITIDGAEAFIGSGSRIGAMRLAEQFGFHIFANDR